MSGIWLILVVRNQGYRWLEAKRRKSMYMLVFTCRLTGLLTGVESEMRKMSLSFVSLLESDVFEEFVQQPK
jgi:hypothetical protein